MNGLRFAASLAIAACMVSGPAGGLAQTADSSAAPPAAAPAAPPMRQIPGINAEDPFPKGCVSCHINMPERGMDMRFSTLMTRWTEKAEPELVAKARATAPAGAKLNGKHPRVPMALKDVPAGCMKCHGALSKKAPPFGRLLHVIHLTGGEQNHFITEFHGECTYCHKLDATAGTWSVPSAPEP